MIKTDLADIYRDYIACLNKQDWPRLEHFVHHEVYYNDQQIGLTGYRNMLKRDFSEIPDLHFSIQLLIFRPASPSEPASLRLFAKGKVPWPRCKREESILYRECVL